MLNTLYTTISKYNDDDDDDGVSVFLRYQRQQNVKYPIYNYFKI